MPLGRAARARPAAHGQAVSRHDSRRGIGKRRADRTARRLAGDEKDQKSTPLRFHGQDASSPERSRSPRLVRGRPRAHHHGRQRTGTRCGGDSRSPRRLRRASSRPGRRRAPCRSGRYLTGTRSHVEETKHGESGSLRGAWPIFFHSLSSANSANQASSSRSYRSSRLRRDLRGWRVSSLRSNARAANKSVASGSDGVCDCG